MQLSPILHGFTPLSWAMTFPDQMIWRNFQKEHWWPLDPPVRGSVDNNGQSDKNSLSQITIIYYPYEDWASASFRSLLAYVRISLSCSGSLDRTPIRMLVIDELSPLPKSVNECKDCKYLGSCQSSIAASAALSRWQSEMNQWQVFDSNSEQKHPCWTWISSMSATQMKAQSRAHIGSGPLHPVSAQAIVSPTSMNKSPEHCRR